MLISRTIIISTGSVWYDGIVIRPEVNKFIYSLCRCILWHKYALTMMMIAVNTSSLYYKNCLHYKRNGNKMNIRLRLNKEQCDYDRHSCVSLWARLQLTSWSWFHFHRLLIWLCFHLLLSEVMGKSFAELLRHRDDPIRYEFGQHRYKYNQTRRDDY